MKTYTVHEAKTHFSSLLRAVERGEVIAIARNKKLVARLIPTLGDNAHRERPRIGECTSDPVETSTDAFQPLNPRELKEWGLS